MQSHFIKYIRSLDKSKQEEERILCKKLRAEYNQKTNAIVLNIRMSERHNNENVTTVLYPGQSFYSNAFKFLYYLESLKK